MIKSDWINDVVVNVQPSEILGGGSVFTGWWKADDKFFSNGTKVLMITDLGSLRVRHDSFNSGVGLTASVEPLTDYRFSLFLFLFPGYNFTTHPHLLILDKERRPIAEGEPVSRTDNWTKVELCLNSGDNSELHFLIHSRSNPPYPFYQVRDFSLKKTSGDEKDLFLGLIREKTVDDNRERFLRDFEPDIIDWQTAVNLNDDGFFTSHGIRTSAGAGLCEFQEQQCSPWNNRRGGVAVRIDGSLASCGDDRWFMCQNAPAWHKFHKNALLKSATVADTVSQDNIGALNKSGACFCPWCHREFKAYLRKRYDNTELRRMGIGKLSHFDIAQYITCEKQYKVRTILCGEIPPKKQNLTILDDRLVREYIKFQYHAWIDAWQDVVKAVKEKGFRAGKSVPVYGNQGNIFWDAPTFIIISKTVDVVWFEAPPFQPSFRDGHDAYSTLIYKLAVAAGGRKKPVWGVQYPEIESVCRGTATSIKLVLSEAYANGAVHLLAWAYYNPTDRNYHIQKKFAEFLNRERLLFLRRKSLANVGLVYSLPSFMFRNFTGLGLSDASELMAKTARVLEDAHIPYDTIIFGKDGFWDDKESLDEISSYRLLILPGFDCISDKQIKALRRFVKGGGKVISIRPETYKDDEFRNLGVSRLWDLIRDNKLPPERKWLLEIERDDAMRILRDTVRDMSEEMAIVKTNAPPTVWLNVWQAENRNRIDVHLINYNLNFSQDRIEPVKDAKFSIRLPAGFSFDKILLISPEDENNKEINFHRKGRDVEFIIECINVYAIVVLTKNEELLIDREIVGARRSLDRLIVASGDSISKISRSCNNLLRTADKSLMKGDYRSARAMVEKAFTYIRSL